MLRIRGSAALSPFRLDKILTAMKAAAPRITHIYAEFWHFAQTSRELAAQESEILTRILTYGPQLTEEQPQGELFLVTPRPGTISPWSSRATDIACHCGLEVVERLERGVAYYVTTGGAPLTEAEQQLLKPLIHDRMTESVFASLDEAARLFLSAEPAALSTV